ncbi:MAG TPA: tetratricopeptide repeat protein, partial [Kofleriaceae bacterium]|nr:tetratricopeptide repeat protein [Kofleriaceae bacterium]
LGFAYLKLSAASHDNVKKAREQFDILLQKHRKARGAEVNANNGLCAAYTKMGEFDRAITICEKIIENPRAIDRGGSVYFNLGQSYLYKKQPRKARTVGQEFIRMRKSEPRGYILVGDSMAQERNWTGALEWYQRAEDNAKASKEYAASIGIKMGIAFRGAKQPQRAIEKLEAARERDPENSQVIRELGLAYMSAGKDDKALATVSKAITAPTFAKLTPAEKVELLTVAGKAAYNQALDNNGKGADEAKGYFEQAHKLNSRDTGVRTGLVKSLTLQSYHAFKAKNVKQAEALLTEALGYDKRNAAANQNMAALTIDKGDCDGARPYLDQLEKEPSYGLIYHRLMGRVALCGKSRDVKSAADHFAAAEKAAGNANLTRAAIYIEWAPLIWDKDLDDAVDKLEAAVQFTAQNPALGKPAQRALALALFRRGWRTMRGGKRTADPVDDFQRASRDPSVLKGNERIAFEFSEALARLDKGDTPGAAKLFDSLAKQGNPSAYLMAPYDKVGAQFFGAYAKYRSGNAAQLRQAAGEFQGLLGGAKGRFGDKVRDLLASCYEQMAYAAMDGSGGGASANLDQAGKYATSADAKKRINHNKAVLKMGSKPNPALRAEFASMGGDPPEALVNKGIMLDREGKSKEAYDAWVQAKAKGARGAKVSDWIATKKRLFNY